MKRTIVWLLLLACLIVAGCSSETDSKLPAYSIPGINQTPIVTTTAAPNNTVVLTPVKVTVFGDTAILATSAVMEYGDEKMIGEPRDISQGGRIGCKDESGNPVRITRVIIMEKLTPRSTKDWFRDLPELESIQGLNLVNTDNVKDMSYMFAGCLSLQSIDADSWNVKNVTNMRGIFEDCNAMRNKPSWYQGT